MNLKNKLAVAGVVLGLAVSALVLFVASSSQSNAIRGCAGVRCAACPDGTHFAPTPGNCCRCLPN
ncbi:MAG TPA: hypothetical protein VJS92_10125 [Candidatus Polarisedimenticolaceae bacterium]|nr:hypothetical protein [Candidatus Polarisedimenticolaceae bacterium]